MKALSKIIMIIAVVTFFSAPVFSLDTNTLMKEERWDLRMIDDAHIRKNLLTNYAYAEHQKYWPNRKTALEQIINQFPDSQ